MDPFTENAAEVQADRVIIRAANTTYEVQFVVKRRDDAPTTEWDARGVVAEAARSLRTMIRYDAKPARKL